MSSAKKVDKAEFVNLISSAGHVGMQESNILLVLKQQGYDMAAE